MRVRIFPGCNAEVYIRAVGGPDAALSEWAHAHIQHLRWDAIQLCLNLKRLVGAELSALDALRLWGGFTRGLKSGIVRSHPVARDTLYSETLSRIYHDRRTRNLLNHSMKQWARTTQAAHLVLCAEILLEPGPRLHTLGGVRVARKLDRERWIGQPGAEHIEFARFHETAGFSEFGTTYFGEFENELHKRLGFREVGKGWIAQDRMVSLLQEAFHPLLVVAEGRPDWLGLQRFDAWIPAAAVAVEYMGLQHFQPAERFGGADQFERVQHLDAQKRRLAADNGVRLFYIRYDEDVGARVADIAASVRAARVQ